MGGRGGIEEGEDYVQDPKGESNEALALDGAGTDSNAIRWERGGGA